MLQFDLKFLENPGTIEKQIMKIIQKQSRIVMRKAGIAVLKRVKIAVGAAIGASPEISSLLGGSLQAELGVANPGTATGEILNAWINSIGITYKTNMKESYFTLYGIKDDWSEALSLPSSKYLTAKGQTIPWLQWLLEAGDATFLVDYDVSMNPQGSNSRTGKAVMVRAKKSWGVPPWAAGTTEDNLVTRSLNEIMPAIQSIMQQELMRAM